jgi:threonylcarbamoyladenosine tRNA methylthiotransferase MtaB
VKEYFPEASLGADVIVGFPGESAEQFDETLAFLESSNLTHLHVFPFSKRNKTVAARLPDQVSPQVKKERVNALIKMGEKKLSELLASMIGKKSQVLIEQEEQGAAGKEGEDPFYIGYTENYLKIKVKGPQIARNAILRVDIVGMDGNLLIGQAY